MSTAGPGGRIQTSRPGDPSRIGPYRIIGRLGSGGMGTVHAGLAPDGLRVAVKVIHSAQAEDADFRARFRREVELSRRVQGPCLIPLLAAEPEASPPWLATAYAPGPTLNQHLADRGPLTGGTLYAFAAGTAQALAAIHAAGVVHRDIKPQNVVLTPAGPRVLDFGIAHAADGTSITRTGVMTGTPGWISPEHYRTGTAGPAGDMFAWGALVAYAATGRLPFGTGAPDVVAFRVMSGEPDLDGMPGKLREIVEKCLAKEPADRTNAASAAEECALLLASQDTQVLGDGAGPEPTRVGELVTAQWDMPPLDDPAWPLPPTRSRKRTVAAILAAAAVVGGIAGGALALPSGTENTTHDAADAQAPPGETNAPRTGPAPSGTGTAKPSVDPRTVGIPKDPLLGVSDPAYTRADDPAQPGYDEWRASTAAAGPEEKDVEEAVRKDMTSILATKDMDFMKPIVTFNRRAQTVMVTGGPISMLTDDYKEVFGRTGAMAACTALAHRLEGAPTTWPYGRYYVLWKDFDGQTEPTFLDFGQATDGCLPETAGQWQGGEAGLPTAAMPSSDKAEIRIADTLVEAVRTAWNTRAAGGQYGLIPFGRDDSISLGFDPVEKAAYVWGRDDPGALVGRAQKSQFQQLVSKTVCQEMGAEYDRNENWNYTRWSVAVYQGNSGVAEFIGSGTCTAD
ncbi:serine/threonine protein kinase [Streptomyces hirsutus]|uniref:serine/threonine protein kinase n=1 Tax=Streptomyces hirsutus TaxID=35620 RepID=UPI0036C7C776